MFISTIEEHTKVFDSDFVDPLGLFPRIFPEFDAKSLFSHLFSPPTAFSAGCCQAADIAANSVSVLSCAGVGSSESTETLTNIDDTLLETTEKLQENKI